MSVSLSKLLGAIALLSLLVFSAGASAAPSLGYPAGRPYYGSGHAHRHVYRSFAPSYTTETRQSFSHEPAEHAVDANNSKADKPAAPKASDSKPAEEHAAAPQTSTRQSYSYEPATQGRKFYRRPHHREAWQLQKTDARRGS